jgi:glucoamylase
MAEILRQRADYYNEMIEFWTYVTKTVVATSAGVEGYYVRIAPSSRLEALPEEIQSQNIVIKNRPEGQNIMKAEDEISVDALALVRFGIRRADDPRIINTVRVIDKFLRSDTSTGPVWHRYRDDGYGEHDDGSAFDGTGRGRGWPLFSGERAHYEIAAGRLNEALKLRKIMESQTSPGGLIPEQIWDSANIPGKGLINGRPSGSAMPLVWAHAEYLKLCRSIELGKVFDMPEPTAKRYIENVSKPKLFDWTFRNKLSWIPLGLDLRISLFDPAKIIWTSDQWESREELDTRDSGLGIHFADIKTDKMKEGSTIIFTMYWKGPDKWEGNNFSVRVI